jgi:diguanylate cyclase (GGDEF)-like protein/PAS domain S-box-containing protein
VIQLSTQRKISIAFAAAIGISVAIGLLSYASVSRLSDDGALVAHTEEVIGALETLLSTATDAESASRAYLITGDEAYLQAYGRAVGEIGADMIKVRALTADNRIQERRFARLSALLAERLGRLDEGTGRSRGLQGTRELIAGARGMRLHEAIHAAIGQMVAEERKLLATRQARTQRSSRTALEAISVGTVLALCVAVIAQLLIKRDFAGARRAQAALRESNSNLEVRIRERTAQLEKANERLGSAYRDLRLLVAQAPLAIAMFDRKMRYIATSRRWVEAFGRGATELCGLSHYDVHPDIPEPWIGIHRRGLAGELINSDEELLVRSDGGRHWVRWAVSPWRNEKGETGGIIIFAEDITPRKVAEERLRLAHAVFENVQEGIVITDLEGKIVAVNPAFRAITEYSECELLGRSMQLGNSGRHDQVFYEEMWACIRATGSWQGEIWDRRKSGETYPQWLGISTVRNDEGAPSYYVGVVADISRMQHAQSHLHYLVHHDPLTGLPNRALLSLRLRHSIERAYRLGTQCAVLFLDLDGFKGVNDAWGHQAGDELLRMAAMRMKDRVREVDTLARLGGDEFVLVLEQITSSADVGDFARDLIAQLDRPFTLTGGARVRVGISIGISLYPGDGSDADSLVRCADEALYRAKQAGRGTWRLYGSEDRARIA